MGHIIVDIINSVPFDIYIHVNLRTLEKTCPSWRGLSSLHNFLTIIIKYPLVVTADGELF